MEVYGVVYLLIDGTNDKEYVGQTTKTAEERFKEHMYSPYYIGKAIRKHGADMFTTAILKICYSKEELDFWEKHFIKSRNTTAPSGYNITTGGEGVAGFTPLPEICSKMSVTQRKESPFKNLIKEIDRCQLSYAALAKLMNLPQCAISGKMQGKQNFSETEWAKLTEILDKPVDYLMARDDEKSPVSKRHLSPYKNLIWEIDNRKFTYTALAKLLNVIANDFSAKMRGICNFSEAEWIKLAEIFDKPAEYLMFRSDSLPAITSKAVKNAKISAAHRQDTTFKNLVCEIDKHKLSYRTLEKLLGLSTGCISMKMRGERKFTARDITKLVEIFGKPAEYLMARDDSVQ